MASNLNRKLGYWYDLLEASEKAFCGERGVNELGFEVECTRSNAIRDVCRYINVELLSLSDLGEVRVASEDMVVRRVSEGDVKVIESILPWSFGYG